MYAWAKDSIGHVSTSLSSSTTVTLPANSYSFGGPSSGQAQVQSSDFTVTPNSVYTGTITITPSGSASTGLSAIILTFSNSSAPQTFRVTPTVSGTLTLTPTNSGGLTNSSGLTYTVGSAPDTTAPTVTAFSIPATSTSLTVSISSFTATDTVGVTGYKLTESSSAPLAGDSGWTGTAPTTYTFSTQGAKTLYAWAKDDAGNVSTSMNATAALIYPVDVFAPVISLVESVPSPDSVNISWTTDEEASSIVYYGLNSSYGASTTEADLSPRVTSHNVQISNLVSCTSYNYQIHSTDGFGNEGISSDYKFTTTGCTGSATIDSQNSGSINFSTGGSLDLLSSNTGITVDVPTGFANTDAEFQIKKLDSSETFSSTSIPTGLTSIGTYTYDLKALSNSSTIVSSFTNPITVSMNYGPRDIVGINVSTLEIYRWDGDGWIELSGCTVDRNLEKVTCTTNNFSVFGLFGKRTSVSSGGGGGGSGVAHPTTITTLPTGNTTPVVTPIVTTPTVTPTTKPIITTSKFKFTHDLKFGMTDIDIKELQEYLNAKGFVISKTGNGSPGKESTYFGLKTQNALIKFQKANKITPAKGYFGAKTRAVVNK